MVLKPYDFLDQKLRIVSLTILSLLQRILHHLKQLLSFGMQKPGATSKHLPVQSQL